MLHTLEQSPASPQLEEKEYRLYPLAMREISITLYEEHVGQDKYIVVVIFGKCNLP